MEKFVIPGLTGFVALLFLVGGILEFVIPGLTRNPLKLFSLSTY